MAEKAKAGRTAGLCFFDRGMKLIAVPFSVCA